MSDVKLEQFRNMPAQSFTESGIIKVEGIAVKLEQFWNMLAQLVTELGILKVEGIVVIEQP